MIVTIFENSENSKTSDSHRLLLNLSDKINVKKSVIKSLHLLYMEKKWCKNNKFKTSALT